MSLLIGTAWNYLKNANPTAAAVTVGLVVASAIAGACCWRGRKVTVVNNKPEMKQLSDGFSGDRFTSKSIGNGSVALVTVDDVEGLKAFSCYRTAEAIAAAKIVTLTITSAQGSPAKSVKDAFLRCFPRLTTLNVYLPKDADPTRYSFSAKGVRVTSQVIPETAAPVGIKS